MCGKGVRSGTGVASSIVANMFGVGDKLSYVEHDRKNESAFCCCILTKQPIEKISSSYNTQSVSWTAIDFSLIPACLHCFPVKVM